MFGKVKQFLGIEGVKIKLTLDDPFKKEDKKASGVIQFFSMHEAKVKGVKLRMVEKFSRGRGKEKLVDEYEMGSIELEQIIHVPANEPIEMEFEMEFDMLQSEMDELQNKNLVLGGVVQAAKWIQGVKSIYYIEAEAIVSGTALNPFDKQFVLLT